MRHPRQRRRPLYRFFLTVIPTHPHHPHSYVLTQFNSHELNAHLAKSYPPALFGSRSVQGFVDTLACTQTPSSSSWYAGSADATRANLGVILRNQRGGPPPAHVLVSSGSALTSLDYGKLVAAHVASGADVTLATHSVPRAGAERRGLVRVDPATGALLAFAEKPAGDAVDAFAHASAAATPTAPYEASMGVYVFTTAALTALLGASVDGEPSPTASDDDDGSAPRVMEHFGRDVIPAALRAGMSVNTLHHDGWWREVASLREYYEAALELAAVDAPAPVATVFVAPPARGAPLPPSRMHASRVTDTLLGEGCVVTGATLSRCVLGNGTHVGRGATLENCVLLGSDALMYSRSWDAAAEAGVAVPGIGAGSTLRGVVVDRNACVGAGVSLTNAARVVEADHAADLGFVVSDSIIVVPRGACVPPGTVF